MRAFPVRMPSGVQYWTVIDSDLRVVPAADAYLRHLRFGRDAADSTTKAYAGAVVLYLSWCAATGQDWRLAAERLPSFVLWLRYALSTSGAAAGAAVRGPRRINCVLAGTRGFLAFAVDRGDAPAHMLGQLYELADSRDLPAEARGEDMLIVAKIGGPTEEKTYPHVDSLRVLLEAYADAIEGKAPFPVRPEQMLDVIGAFEAVITSLAKGAPVKLAR